MRPGDVLAGRYRLVVLLHERNEGRFWRAWDTVLARHVALHLIPVDDARAPLLQDAARLSATVQDPHLLRVLDTNTIGDLCYVVNEWGEGTSLNNMVAEEPLAPLRAAWLVAEAATMVAAGHAAGVAHGRLVPENLLLDTAGAVKVIGFAVDAALHGLPPGRWSADVTDLGGLLYTALTGRWTGVSESGVPAAPFEHGKPLRPRQVRAGVPRALDAICEDLLGGGGRLTTAQQVVDALLAYVGDPAVVAQAELDRAHGRTPGPVRREPAPAAHDTSANEIPAVAPAIEPEASPAPGPVTPTEPARLDPLTDPSFGTLAPAADARDQSPPDDDAPTQISPAVDESDVTQAGAPVFFDELDEVGWHTPRGQTPPPPPPFEEPPERPLFAPDPPEGRLRRLPLPTNADSDYWPFSSESTSSSVIEEPVTDDERVPGRSWLRIGGILLGGLLLVLLVVSAIDRFGGSDDGGRADGEPSDSTSTTAAITGLTATDFDPFDDARSEHPDEVGRAVDDDPASAWSTSSYQQDLGPSGLKPGVGLVIDLGEEREVSQVTVAVRGDPTAVELRSAGNAAPTALDQAGLVAKGTSADGTVQLAPKQPITSRYLVIWLTSLPQSGGEFVGGIADVTVRG